MSLICRHAEAMRDCDEPHPKVGTMHECFYCGADVDPVHAFMDRASGMVKCGECVRHEREQRLIAAGRIPKDGDCSCLSCVTEGMEPQRPDCRYWRAP